MRPVLDLPGSRVFLLVDKLHRRPDRNGGEGVEDLLHPAVKLPDVVDLQAGLGDLQGARQVLVAHVHQVNKLQVEVLHGHLQAGEVGGLAVYWD